MIKKIIPADTSRNKEVIVYITFEVDPGLSSKSYEGSLNALVTNRGVHIQFVEACYEQALKSEFKINHRYVTNGLQARVIFLFAKPANIRTIITSCHLMLQFF